MANSEWQDRALCKGNTALFFDNSQRNQAKSICRRCPIWQPCLDFAMAETWVQGVWGGTTENERKKLRKARSAM